MPPFPRHPRLRHAAALAIALPLVGAAPAAAATRYAGPSSPDPSGPCTMADPCGVRNAIEGAQSGDEVVVAPGTYQVLPRDTIYYRGISSSKPLNVHGVTGQPRPRLLGDPTLLEAPLSLKGGAESQVSHLLVSSVAAGQDAFVLQGGVADDLVLVSQTGDGAKLVGTSGGTVLRDSVAHSGGGTTTSSGRGLKLQDGNHGSGPVDVRNVTAIADDPTAAGIESQMTTYLPTLRNVIARGGSFDLTGKLSVSSSNFRSGSYSQGVTDAGQNQSGDPLFVDAPHGVYELQAGSPAIDAGVDDTGNGPSDPDGRPRRLGAAPEIGAFEFGPAPAGANPSDASAVVPGSDGTATPTSPAPGGDVGTPGSTSDPAAPSDPLAGLPPLPRPEAGHSVDVAPTIGVVKVRLPGRRDFVPLGSGMPVPVGATIDARAGAVRLVSTRDASPTTLQSGIFSGAQFQVRQDSSTRHVTVLALRGGDFRGCGVSAYRPVAQVAGRRHRVVRQLWGRDNGGRFRTDGRFAAALVRGTVWLTQDRCDGTLVRVAQGKVVVHDRGARRDVVVRAGHSYLARPARRRG